MKKPYRPPEVQSSMNLNHFFRTPLPWARIGTHELKTHLAYLDRTGMPAVATLGVEHAVLECSCGWRIARPLFQMYDGPRAAFFDALVETAQAHIFPPPLRLDELAELGWFDPGVW